MSCPTTAASAAGVRAAGRASRVEVRPARRAPAPLHAVKEVFMPALSSTMTEGKIVSWLKSEGDKARAVVSSFCALFGSDPASLAS